jgi:hypothetical protein
MRFLEFIESVALDLGEPNNFVLKEALRIDALGARTVALEKRFNNSKTYDESTIQTITCVALDVFNSSLCESAQSEKILRSKKKLPKPLLLKDGMLFLSISNTLVNKKRVNITIIKPEDVSYLEHRKFTGRDVFATYENDYIWIHNTLNLNNISVRGLFSNPIEVKKFEKENVNDNLCSCESCFSLNALCNPDNPYDECFNEDDFELDESLATDMKRIIYAFKRDAQTKNEIEINE